VLQHINDRLHFIVLFFFNYEAETSKSIAHFSMSRFLLKQCKFIRQLWQYGILRSTAKNNLRPAGRKWCVTRKCMLLNAYFQRYSTQISVLYKYRCLLGTLHSDALRLLWDCFRLKIFGPCNSTVAIPCVLLTPVIELLLFWDQVKAKGKIVPVL
jgi:hypothetical protein